MYLTGCLWLLKDEKRNTYYIYGYIYIYKESQKENADGYKSGVDFPTLGVLKQFMNGKAD